MLVPRIKDDSPQMTDDSRLESASPTLSYSRTSSRSSVILPGDEGARRC
jgi:hypothetical protein